MTKFRFLRFVTRRQSVLEEEIAASRCGRPAGRSISLEDREDFLRHRTVGHLARDGAFPTSGKVFA